MAKNKTPNPKVPTVEETPVVDPVPEEETFDDVPMVGDPVPEEETFDDVPMVGDPVPEEETSNEAPTVEETPVVDPEAKPMSNREAARMLREKHQG